nr:hypothetical protein [Tanacetum cinerariifolium]
MHRQHHRDLRLHPRRRPAANTSSHNTPLSTTTATVTISNSRHPHTIIISPLPPLSPHHSRQPPTCNTTTIFATAPLSPSTPYPRRHQSGHRRHNLLPTTLTLFTPQPPPPSPHHCCPHHHDPPAPPPAFAAVNALTRHSRQPKPQHHFGWFGIIDGLDRTKRGYQGRCLAPTDISVPAVSSAHAAASVPAETVVHTAESHVDDPLTTSEHVFTEPTVVAPTPSSSRTRQLAHSQLAIISLCTSSCVGDGGWMDNPYVCR